MTKRTEIDKTPCSADGPWQCELLTCKGGRCAVWYRTREERDEAVRDARLNLWPRAERHEGTKDLRTRRAAMS